MCQQERILRLGLMAVIVSLPVALSAAAASQTGAGEKTQPVALPQQGRLAYGTTINFRQSWRGIFGRSAMPTTNVTPTRPNAARNG